MLTCGLKPAARLLMVLSSIISRATSAANLSKPFSLVCFTKLFLGTRISVLRPKAFANKTKIAVFPLPVGNFT